MAPAAAFPLVAPAARPTAADSSVNRWQLAYAAFVLQYSLLTPHLSRQLSILNFSVCHSEGEVGKGKHPNQKQIRLGRRGPHAEGEAA